jgi:fucose permease
LKTLALPTSRRSQINLSFFGFIVIGMYGGGWGVVLPYLSEFYHVQNTVVGLLFLASALGYFLSALAGGYLAQKLGLRWYLISGSSVFLAANFLVSITPPFIAILLTRLLLGFGMAVIETGLNMFITALPNNTSQMNYLHAFYGLGALIGPLIASGMLAVRWQWNLVNAVWAFFTLLLLTGFVVLFRFQLPGEGAQRKEIDATGANSLMAALKLPMVWLASLFLLFYVGIEVSLGNWSYSFLVVQRHDAALLSGWIVSGYWLGLTLGRFVLNNLAQRLHLGISGMMYSCIAGVMLGVLFIWLVPGQISDALGFALIGFCLGPIYPTTVALLPRLVPSHIVGNAIGLLIGISIIGIAIFPWLAGVLAQFTSLWSLLPYTMALVVIMFCLWVPIARKRITPSQESLDLQEVSS